MSSKSTTWQELLDTSEQLPVNDQLRLLIELASRLKPALTPSKESVDLLTLAGVGQDIWNTVDTDTYIDQERDSWQN